ncbi:hypothetical protein QB910_000046 [Dabrowskivirus KKP3916]|uniref:Uncharacterized protein n=1 Tax=Alicyclobacillus phage KKP_3916 TaxID=3040651 RepID=A0AAT9V7I3_9CAUD|nr:hypothetical protein QB910_000046 [Alicyclobacillus phage KKP 3916]
MADAIYTGTLSSGGRKTTTQANQEVIFNSPNAPSDDPNAIKVTGLLIDAFDTQIHVTINDEVTIHEIDPNTSLNLSEIVIDKFTILENGVDYRWTAIY